MIITTLLKPTTKRPTEKRKKRNMQKYKKIDKVRVKKCLNKHNECPSLTFSLCDSMQINCQFRLWAILKTLLSKIFPFLFFPSLHFSKRANILNFKSLLYVLCVYFCVFVCLFVCVCGYVLLKVFLTVVGKVKQQLDLCMH